MLLKTMTGSGVSTYPCHVFDRVQDNVPDGLRLAVVRKVDAELDPPFVGARVVDDGVCQHIRVRQDDHTSIGGSHFGGAQVNRQHGPIEAFHADGFPHMEWLLEQQDDPGGKVLHDVL